MYGGRKSVKEASHQIGNARNVQRTRPFLDRLVRAAVSIASASVAGDY
jgi:hypothetical protein